MITFVVGFIMGLLSFPLIYYLSPKIAAEINQKRMLRVGSRSKTTDITDDQARVLMRSMHRCTDIHWINAIVQRFYLEFSRSHAAESRVRTAILRKFESLKAGGYIRNIEISSIVLGKEAPYVESIQVLSKDDAQKIVSSGDYDIGYAVDEEERLMRLESEIREGLELDHKIFRRETGGIMDDNSDDVQDIKTEYGLCVGLTRSTTQEGRDETECAMDSSTDAPGYSARESSNVVGEGEVPDKTYLSENVFDRLQVLLGMEYKGGIRVSLNLELPKKIAVKVTVFINGFKGDVLVRLPSKDYDTRCEYCFLSNPNFMVTVESGISNAMGRLYFRKSMSNFLERYIKQVLLRNTVYPSWVTLYLPLVIPSIRNIDHRIEKVTLENHSVQVPLIAENILLYSSMDYRIVEAKNNVVYRRMNYQINKGGTLSCTHFSIPKESLRITHLSGKNLFFRGLTIQESRVMSQLYDWSIFSEVISSFHELRVESNLDGSSSLVKLVFEDSLYEFVRIVVKNSLIFQKNDPDVPEFILFRIEEEVLYIYQYVVTDSFSMNGRRIDKLCKRLSMKPLTALGSASLYKFIRFSKKAACSYLRDGSGEPAEDAVDTQPAEEDGEDVKTELVDIFEDIKRSIGDGEYVSKKMCSKAHPEAIYRVLAQDEVRVKLFSEDCDIYTVVSETDSIRSIIVENRTPGTNRSVSSERLYTRGCVEDTCQGVVRMEGDFVIHSYFSTGLIIDMRIHESREVFIYQILPMEENSCEYRSKILLLYSKDTNLCFPNYFVEAFQLRIRQDEYLTIAEDAPYENSPINKEFRREIHVSRGAVYIEFYTELPDDYSFILHSARSGDVIYDIYKVITSRRARIVLPVVGEHDVLTVILTPKFSRNRHIHHKFLSLPEQFHTETLVDCNIGLSKNMKFHCPVVGNRDLVIFWEKTDDDEVKGYIEDGETRVTITKSGSMRTDNGEYHIFYKNKGEKKREIKVFVGCYLRKIQI